MIEKLGTTPQGESVHRVRIGDGGLTAQVLTFGAVVQDLRLDGHRPPLVLGFDRLDDYFDRSPYFGAIVGRYANRIGGARFSLDGREYAADANFLGKHILHGGSRGAGKRVWTIADHGADFVTLALRMVDGEMGFPGNLDVACTYRVTADAALSVEIVATADAPTLANFSHHSYFNLDDGGATPILDHRLEIAAGAYLPVDAEAIPTGEIRPVDGTPFDFRKLRSIGTEAEYDHNFCLAPARREPVEVVRLEGARSGVSMTVSTGEPGLQFYAGLRAGREVPGLDGVRYGAHAGLCLEAQVWPDAPNKPHFPQAVLRPGETLRQVTVYRYGRA